MEVEELRAALEAWAVATGRGFREALLQGDEEAARQYEIEAELLLRIIALIDGE